MHSVLQGLKSISGVRGVMLSDYTGGIIAHSMPDCYGLAELQAAGSELDDKVLGLQEATGGAKQFDIRFEQGRIILRPFKDYYLLVMCEPAINLQLLSISINVIVNKLERLLPQSPTPLKYLAVEVVSPVEPQSTDLSLPKLHKPQLRSAKLLERFNRDFS